MGYFCHSGGCPGSDMEWEIQGRSYGVKTIAYSFRNHVQESENQWVLTVEELKEGYQAAEKADETLKRNFSWVSRYPYVKNLLGRNWFQVKNSEAIFAISRKFLKKNKIVDGGTGWAVQMSIDNKKPTFVFNQPTNEWNKFNYDTNQFEVITEIPTLTKHFAGIGTREIDTDGKNAITAIYEKNLCIQI